MNKKLLILTLLFFGISSAFVATKKPSLKSAKKKLEGFCSYVPSGKTVVEGDTSSVQSFYMSSTEITNIQYAAFLHHLKREGAFDKLKIAQVDSAQWVNNMGYGEAYKKHYHSHPAYRDYPVVNVSKEGAELFCEWLTKVYDSVSNGELKLKFRIPTRAEWMRAVRGDSHTYQFAWGVPSLTNQDGQHRANHLRVGDQNIHRNTETNKLEIVSGDKVIYPDFSTSDNNDVTAPAKSYWPNQFGFYNMNGNVAEMVSDGAFAVGGAWQSPGYDIRNESIVPFSEPKPTIGFRVVATYLEQQ